MSDQVWIRYPCFCFLKLFIFICGFSAKVTYFLLIIETTEKLSEQNTFLVRKDDVFFHFFDQIKVIKGTTSNVKQAMLFLQSSSLKITMTVPLTHLCKSLKFQNINVYNIWPDNPFPYPPLLPYHPSCQNSFLFRAK